MSIGSGGERSSSVTTACTAFDEGAKDEALSRRSGKGRVHAGVGGGLVDSPFIIDRGVFGSENLLGERKQFGRQTMTWPKTSLVLFASATFSAAKLQAIK
jgi:hypothetical protein